MKVLDIRGSIKTLLVPAAAYLAERNPEAAGKISEYHLCFKSYSPADSEFIVPHHQRVFTHPSESKNRLQAHLDIYRKARAVIRERGIEVITVQDQFFLGFIGCALKKEFGLPLNMQSHFSFVNDPYYRSERFQNRLRYILGRALMKRADSFYVGTSVEKRDLMGLGVPEDRIWYHPYTIDGDTFTGGDEDKVRSRYLGKKRRRLLLFVGSLIAQKDPDTLLESMRRVVGGRDDVMLLVLGRGPEEGRLKELVRRLGLSDHVRFTGHVDYREIPAYYRAADLVVVSSIYEGTCRVLLEAAVTGTAAVTTEVAGARDSMVDQETGFVVPIKDPEAMAARILEALHDPERLMRMGKNFQERFRSNYSIDRFFNTWVSMLEYTAGLSG